MVSKKDMVKVLTKAQLLTAARKKRIKVAKSWTKDEIASKLPFDVIKEAYSSIKTVKKKKVAKKKSVKKKTTRKKVVKKKTVKKKVAKR